MFNKQKSRTITYTIVHAIPGRVRFRVPLLASDLDYGLYLQTMLTADTRIIAVRINRNAASIVINYEVIDCNHNQMHEYLARQIQDAILHKKNNVKVSLEDSNLTDTNQNLEPEETHDLKLPTLATFLAVLGLGLPIPSTLIAASVTLAALPVAKRAFTSISIQRKLNIDCLDLIAIALSAAQGNMLTPALVMMLHEIGDAIRDRTARISQNHAADLLDSLGHYAWVVQANGEKKQIPATAVTVGDTVIVYPGEQIPVDGKVLQGTALIDQQKLTGESMPVMKAPGTEVFASTLVREGQIYIRAHRVGNNTRAGASIQLVQQAPVHDTRMANYAASVAELAVLPALIFSGMVLAATRNPARAASILTLDFVTGIRISLPTTFLAALNHATRHGVLIRSGRALEKLAQVDTLVFDKTGTLTRGEIEVVVLETITEGISAERVLELAAAAEQRLTHPVAEAVIDYAQRQGVKILPRGEWNYEIGLGVKAEIEGEQVLVGSDRFLQQHGISLDCLYQEHTCNPDDCPYELNCHISAHDSLLYVAVNGELQGIINYTDPLRLESPEVIHKLQTEYGMEIHLLTGDSQQRATAVAEKLGIPLSQVHAEAFPEHKAEIIRRINESGKTVAFTGDGLNDSVALAYADVSISFGNGSEIARETADVVLMDNDLTSFIEAIAIARETKQVIDQNIGLAVVPNLAALGLASTVGMHPLAATVVHNGSAIAAGLNGLRPLMHRDPPRGEMRRWGDGGDGGDGEMG
ncbi:MAG: heavy metal translocating P-type ATPase [Nostocaceae cyanobacterium]|nr:heavy metal translocating P-type ATPase [Nostocaceae cyanobacterium]